jgi:hypothetical protein
MLAQADFSKTVLQIAHVAKPKTPLELKVDGVVNLVKVRVKELGIQEAAESLRLHVLDLRQSMFAFFAQNDLHSNQYLTNLSEYRTETIGGKYLNSLQEELAEVLEVHHHIFEAIAEKTGLKEFGQVSKAFPPSIEDLFLIPDVTPEVIQHWIEKSVDFEFSLILANLLMEGDLVLNRSKVKQVITFMDQTVSSYGGFIIFLKLWEPSYEEIDHSRLMMNMHIMAGVYSSKYRIKPGNKMTIEEMKAYLLTEA